MGKASTGQTRPGLARSGAGKGVPVPGNSIGEGSGAGRGLELLEKQERGVWKAENNGGRGRCENSVRQAWASEGAGTIERSVCLISDECVNFSGQAG